MEVNITEEKFKAYRELQNSGEINMLDYINGCKLTGLNKEEYIDIIHNYNTYREKFNI
mgnify:FL=1